MTRSRSLRVLLLPLGLGLGLLSCTNPSGWMAAIWPPRMASTLATPVIGLNSGIYKAAISVPIGGPAGATLLYTLDGTDPTPTSPVYAGPVPIAPPASQAGQGLFVLKVRASQSGWTDSAVASATFIVDPWMKKYIGSGPDSLSDGIAAVLVALNGPDGICLNAAGDLYVADTSNDVVRVVSHGSTLTYF
ncbi:MAG TPA: chitobiase/beta-hexosaminidase C-terminal domain-containing protein, partial [Rectinemataceae bacterium]|nr:chitobiase/beta-hexosaminidase C-terminal domain-containing protein [Rectinemataceae bacterium]